MNLLERRFIPFLIARSRPPRRLFLCRRCENRRSSTPLLDLHPHTTGISGYTSLNGLRVPPRFRCEDRPAGPRPAPAQRAGLDQMPGINPRFPPGTTGGWSPPAPACAFGRLRRLEPGEKLSRPNVASKRRRPEINPRPFIWCKAPDSNRDAHEGQPGLNRPRLPIPPALPALEDRDALVERGDAPDQEKDEDHFHLVP